MDAGRLRITLSKTLTPINAATLREAHWLVETGGMTGKLVVEGGESVMPLTLLQRMHMVPLP